MKLFRYVKSLLKSEKSKKAELKAENLFYNF